MNKPSITIEEAKTAIWKALDVCRTSTRNTEDGCASILDVLLWATCVPASKGKATGYFDVMDSVRDSATWSEIEKCIDQQCNRPEDTSNPLNRLSTQEIEQLRSALLGVARSLVNGGQSDRKSIVEALLLTREELVGRRGFFGCSYMMGRLWRELTKGDNEGPIACLFPMGVGVTPFLIDEHQVLTHCANSNEERWIKGLVRLLGAEKAIGSINPEDGWTTAIASPPWREVSRETLKEDPWLAGATLNCPDSIKDTEARRIYSAHQLSANKTYALASPAIGFSSAKDLEYFRSELIRKNWLEAVIELPTGAYPGTTLGGLLLVLSHKRQENQPIAIISAETLLLNPGSKAGRDPWKETGGQELAKTLMKPQESDFCTFVTAAELEANGYKLQVSRYLKSKGDAAIEQYLKSRPTILLGDLAEVKRPLAALGKKAEGGITTREVTIADISDAGIVIEGSKTTVIEESTHAKNRDQLLEERDVLLSIKGSIGKAAIVGNISDQVIPGQAFCVIRPRANAPISPEALVQYLRSDIGQALIQKSSQGTGVAFVPMGEVKSIPVVIPTDQEAERSKQIQSTSAELSLEVKRLTIKLQELSSRGWLEDVPTC